MRAEIETTEPTEPTARVPATVPDTKLTLKKNRLAGSADCMNCGTELMGPFCHYCGQPDKNLMRFFPALLRELLEDFMDFDSRFMRTLKPLLFKPGKLTRDYLDGRRFRYVPPLRLYIFSSIALFFLFAVIAPNTLKFGSGLESVDEGITITMDEDDKADLHDALEGLEDIQPGFADRVSSKIEKAENPEQPEDSLEMEDLDLNFNGEPWDPETNPLILPLMPNWVNDWLNREIGESPQKGKAMKENPNLMLDKILDVLPGTMFVLLPLVALLLKFWYLFARKYYVEHLIFALHNHAFIFIVLLFTLLLSAFTDWREPEGGGAFTESFQLIQIITLIWVPLYMLLAMKRVYQQGWWLTLAKYSAVGISYLVLLTFVSVFVAALSFLLL